MSTLRRGGAGLARSALALAALYSLLAKAHAGVMAVGKLQSCVDDGTVRVAPRGHRRQQGSLPLDCASAGCTCPQTPAITVPHSQTPSTSLTCSQKIVVTVELENNKIYATEQLNFGVSCINRRGSARPIGRWRLPLLRRPLLSARASQLYLAGA